MKRNILVGLLTVGFVVSAFSQGTVNFVNVNSAAGLRSPVYGPDPANPSSMLQGNTATGLPAGTTVYAGPLLTGTGYSAQLWAASGADQAEASLVGAANAVTDFRTGSAAGFVTALGTYQLAGVARDAAAATLQMRVWDNTGGVTSYDAAVARGYGYGKSSLFNVSGIGGDLNPPPLLDGLRSFNITGQGGVIIPEPSSFALAGLGAAALLIFRRRK